MCPGLSDDLQQIDDARKTAIIDRELSKLNIDIAALQEARLPSGGSLKEKDYTFFWQASTDFMESALRYATPSCPQLSLPLGDSTNSLFPPHNFLWTHKHL